MFSLNCKGRILSLDRPIVMGILNLTPDSFFDGSRILYGDQLLERARQMLEEGASILDIGGQSTRPGAPLITEDEERKRVIPAIKLLKEHIPETIISIDTFYGSVAEEAIKAGASIINDVSGGRTDPSIQDVAAAYKIPYVLMHSRGTPQTMQNETSYKDLMASLLDYFTEKLFYLRSKGITDVIIDPGFGFAKTIDQNFGLLSRLEQLSLFSLPVMVGVSRKSTIYKTLQSSPESALNGSTVLHTIALLQGASILRVHDVREAMESILLTQRYKTQKAATAAS